MANYTKRSLIYTIQLASLLSVSNAADAYDAVK